MLFKIKGGGQGQRERGEGERGKEICVLILLKKG